MRARSQTSVEPARPAGEKEKGIGFVAIPVLTVLIAVPMRKKGWIREGDLKLPD